MAKCVRNDHIYDHPKKKYIHFILPLYLTSLRAFRCTNLTMLPHLNVSLITCNNMQANVGLHYILMQVYIVVWSIMLTKTNVLQITQEAWVCLSSASQRRDESSSLHVGYIPSSCTPQRSRTHLLPCWTLCSHALPTYYTRNCSVLTDKPSAKALISYFSCTFYFPWLPNLVL